MPKFKYLHREEGRTYVCFDLTGEYSLQRGSPGTIRYVIKGPAKLKDTGVVPIQCTINHGGGIGTEFKRIGDLPKGFPLEPGDEVRVEANGDLAILKQTPPPKNRKRAE
jgi:hypothetical protein